MIYHDNSLTKAEEFMKIIFEYTRLSTCQVPTTVQDPPGQHSHDVYLNRDEFNEVKRNGYNVGGNIYFTTRWGIFLGLSFC